MEFRRRRRESRSRLEVPRFDVLTPDSGHNSKRRSGSAHQRPCTERARMRTKRIWWSLRLALLTHLRSPAVRLVFSFVDVTVAAPLRQGTRAIMFQFGLRDYWHDVVLREDSSTRFAITSRIFAATSGRSMVEGSNSAFEGCCNVLWRMGARLGLFDLSSQSVPGSTRKAKTRSLQGLRSCSARNVK